MIKYFLIIILMSVSFFIFSPDIALSLDMKEGLCEITVKTEIEEGMTAEIPAETIRQCIKKEHPFFETEKPDKNCKILSKQIKGNTVSIKMQCKDEEGSFTVLSTGTYRRKSFDGAVEYRENGRLMMKGKISGRWIGECK